MSALQSFPATPDRKREEEPLVDVSAAAELADCHPETIRDAARAGLLHGLQRRRVDPKTGRIRTKGGTWKFHQACVIKWAEGEDCAHQVVTHRAPVALASFSGRNR